MTDKKDEWLLGSAAGKSGHGSAPVVVTARDATWFRAGWRAGFTASGEGWNGEYPPPPDPELKKAEDYALGLEIEKALLQAQSGEQATAVLPSKLVCPHNCTEKILGGYEP